MLLLNKTLYTETVKYVIRSFIITRVAVARCFVNIIELLCSTQFWAPYVLPYSGSLFLHKQLGSDQGRFYARMGPMEGPRRQMGAQLTTDKLAPAILVMQ